MKLLTAQQADRTGKLSGTVHTLSFASNLFFFTRDGLEWPAATCHYVDRSQLLDYLLTIENCGVILKLVCTQVVLMNIQ